MNHPKPKVRDLIPRALATATSEVGAAHRVTAGANNVIREVNSSSGQNGGGRGPKRFIV